MRRTISDTSGFLASNPPWPLTDAEMSHFERRLRLELEATYLTAHLAFCLFVDQADERGRIRQLALTHAPLHVTIHRGEALFSVASVPGNETHISIPLPEMTRPNRLLIAIQRR